MNYDPGGPWIRTVNIAGEVQRMRDDELARLAASMSAKPKNFLPRYRRAVAAEIERRAQATPKD